MSAAPAFADSNVLLYLLSGDTTKAARTEALLLERPTIGVQVLNEFANVAHRKFGMPWPEVVEVLDGVRRLCVVRPLTAAVHDAALALVQRHAFTWYDALILAAAQDAGCRVLWSEDLQHGLHVRRQLTVRNPFFNG